MLEDGCFLQPGLNREEEGGVVVLDLLPCLSGGHDQDPIFASDFIPLIAVTCLLLRKQDLFTEQSLACSF